MGAEPRGYRVGRGVSTAQPLLTAGGLLTVCLPEAVRYALEAGDPDLAASLVEGRLSVFMSIVPVPANEQDGDDF